VLVEEDERMLVLLTGTRERPPERAPEEVASTMAARTR